MDLPELGLPVLDRLALLVVDVQQGFDDGGYWGPRNNPDCEDNIAVLLQTWRQHGRWCSSATTRPRRSRRCGPAGRATPSSRW